MKQAARRGALPRERYIRTGRRKLSRKESRKTSHSAAEWMAQFPVSFAAGYSVRSDRNAFATDIFEPESVVKN
jgi:hypothetical protein